MQSEKRILNLLFEKNPTESFRFIGHQINVVDNKGHQLLTLCGGLLAISAALIPNVTRLVLFDKIILILGCSFIFISALINSIFVFRLKWITNLPFSNDMNVDKLNKFALSVRDRKTKGYHISLIVFVAGLLFYSLAIVSILLKK